MPLLTRKRIPHHVVPVAFRWAAPEDALALARLAALDEEPAPRGRVLLAEVGEEPWAAMSAEDGHAVADPFRPSAELVLELGERLRAARRIRR